jgi:hypothetical protein
LLYCTSFRGPILSRHAGECRRVPEPSSTHGSPKWVARHARLRPAKRQRSGGECGPLALQGPGKVVGCCRAGSGRFARRA